MTNDGDSKDDRHSSCGHGRNIHHNIFDSLKDKTLQMQNIRAAICHHVVTLSNDGELPLLYNMVADGDTSVFIANVPFTFYL